MKVDLVIDVGKNSIGRKEKENIKKLWDMGNVERGFNIYLNKVLKEDKYSMIVLFF